MEIKHIKPKPQKKKVGRPKATDKKDKLTLYSTAEIKRRLETIASEYGLTSSQLLEVMVNRLYSMDEFNLNDFVGLKKVSAEEQQKIIERHQNKPFKAEKPHELPIRSRENGGQKQNPFKRFIVKMIERFKRFIES